MISVEAPRSPISVRAKIFTRSECAIPVACALRTREMWVSRQTCQRRSRRPRRRERAHREDRERRTPDAGAQVPVFWRRGLLPGETLALVDERAIGGENVPLRKHDNVGPFYVLGGEVSPFLGDRSGVRTHSRRRNAWIPYRVRDSAIPRPHDTTSWRVLPGDSLARVLCRCHWRGHQAEAPGLQCRILRAFASGGVSGVVMRRATFVWSEAASGRLISAAHRRATEAGRYTDHHIRRDDTLMSSMIRGREITEVEPSAASGCGGIKRHRDSWRTNAPAAASRMLGRASALPPAVLITRPMMGLSIDRHSRELYVVGASRRPPPEIAYALNASSLIDALGVSRQAINGHSPPTPFRQRAWVLVQRSTSR